jgi:hypothetical protein
VVKGYSSEPYLGVIHTGMACSAPSIVGVMYASGYEGVMLPPYIYFTRFCYLPNTLERLVHQITLNFKLVHFKSGKAVVGDSECDLERRGGSGLSVTIYQLCY